MMTRNPRHNSRSKGKRGELEWRDVLRDLGYLSAERGQQRAGGADAPDVKNGIPGTHPEVKRVEALNIHKAMAQAVGDAVDLVPYVAHRRNRTDWLVTIRASDLVEFARLVANSQQEMT
ncbi:MAG: hypothetical protein AAGI37_20980 [Planctomycetota bacterium]